MTSPNPMALEAKALDPAHEIQLRIARAIFDPGATEGQKGDRTLSQWQTDAVMRVINLAALPPPAAGEGLEPVAAPPGIDEHDWRQLTDGLIKEAERTCGPGIAMDAVRYRLRGEGRQTALAQMKVDAPPDVYAIVETVMQAIDEGADLSTEQCIANGIMLYTATPAARAAVLEEAAQVAEHADFRSRLAIEVGAEPQWHRIIPPAIAAAIRALKEKT